MLFVIKEQFPECHKAKGKQKTLNSMIKTVTNNEQGIEFEFICVLRCMQRYFSHTCDGTDVQAD